MRRYRGDLSAPVLAIIVTIGVIAAGLVLMAWFWWFAPQAGKTGSIVILGQPALICNSTSNYYKAVVSLKNTGSDIVTISKAIIAGVESTPTSIQLQPGESQTVEFSFASCPAPTGVYTVDGVILTSAGTYSTSFTVIR